MAARSFLFTTNWSSLVVRSFVGGHTAVEERQMITRTGWALGNPACGHSPTSTRRLATTSGLG